MSNQMEQNRRYIKKNKHTSLSAFCIRKHQQMHRRARASGAEFGLTAAEMREVWEVQRGRCFFTDKEMEFIAYDELLRPNHSLGCCVRVRHDQGWYRNNIVWVVWPLALMMATFEYDALEETVLEWTKTHRLDKRYKVYFD